jgi:hypothetical protein
MWLQKFLTTIKGSIPFLATPIDLDALERLDTSRIYVENVRSVLGVSSREAEKICDTAVRQGIFDQLVEIRCPDGSVAMTLPHGAELPASVRCIVDDEDGFPSEEFIPTDELLKRRVYRLSNDTAA